MTETVTLFNGRWLRIKARNGWEFAERVNPRGAVIVVALTPARELLFVEQYRPPIQATTIEMPAGLIGDLAGSEDEDILESARRELEEETGYQASRLDYVMGGPVSAGMSTEYAHFIRATGLTQVSAGGGDETEQIVVHRVPLAEAAVWLMAKQAEGFPMDPKIWSGLYFAERDARGQLWPEPTGP
ncbi:DNA mismatch repair protein MutT [Ahniella affigens]|uniref:GDP-mannose pyrophosphatase n=1 Tax=Ahniella affigens TaxID=2021234 RepID=A0A2P1PSA3_9GAMM|nr:NUDIX hydrolase [Ahniella affigens]AVP97736.1 DNA mismatch repair protein MutT [Ahniella affigens]